MPDGRRRFSIDTGSSGAFEMPTLDRLPMLDVPRVTGVARSITGDTTTIGGRMDGSLSFGGTIYRYPLLESTSGTARIGASAFRSGTLYLDAGSSVVAFRSRHGSSFIPRGERRLPLRIDRAAPPWTVTGGLDRQWLPRLGIDPGERILAVDGTPVENFGCRSIDDVAGTRSQVVLTISDGTTTREVIAPLIEMTPPAP